jgi:uncharacterized membrane protein YqhA
MRFIYKALTTIIGVISILFYVCGLVITALGVYEMFHVLYSMFDDYRHHKLAAATAVGLLQAIDLFLIAIVFFVFGLGLTMIFTIAHPLESQLPEWLRIRNFTQLKVLLWEAILTTLVIAFLNTLAQKRIVNGTFDPWDLIIPVGVLMIAASLFLLKKSENH